MTDLLPEQEPPTQRPAPESKHPDSEMQTTIACSPALGQASCIPHDRHSVKFTVLLETATPSSDSRDDQFQVCVWHNHNGQHEWSELRLQPQSETDGVLLTSRSEDDNITRSWFTAELSGSPKHAHVVSFTVKYRSSPSQDWQWAKDSLGLSDGELHYSSAELEKHASYDLKHFFSDISPDITIASKSPETDKTHLWELTCPVNAARGLDSGYCHHSLGRATHASKWFALVRLWSPWLAPRHGSGDEFELDKDGVLLSFLRSDGLHVVVLGISGVEDVMSTFIHGEHSTILIKGRNDRDTTGTGRVLVAVADSFEVANAAVFYEARRVVSEHGSIAASSDVESLMKDNVKAEWLEEWYDGLTYCTWNGLGQNLTAPAIYRALDELSKNNINVTNLIIDDNWQSLASGDNQFKRGWSDFEANSGGFPDGMKATTAEIRKRHPNVNHIAVWHAILGYWGGIDPDGKIAARYKTIEVEKEPGVAEGRFTVVAAEDAARMYDDFYRFLSDSGIDAVKTDAQFFLDMLLHAPDRRKLITEYQDAWTIAHLRHFSSRAISCMSQFPQALFHSQLPRNKPRLLVRNSDDFFPEVEASHAWHIFCNAHNSLLMQHLNALPDWDMFQTSHDWASFHAAARCVSGGPIYFTDVPGKHDITLIRQMTAQTPRDKTVILRPSVVGKTVDIYNSYQAQVLLKVGTYHGGAQTGSGILGVFNVSHQKLSELIHLESFPGTEKGKYVVASFASGRISEPVSRASSAVSDTVVAATSLEPRGWDILTAYAVQSLQLHERSIEVAVVGLVGKMTGCAAVNNYDVFTESNGRLRVSVSLKALGVLGVWISDLDRRNVQDLMVTMFGKPVPEHCVRSSASRPKVLEIDVETAWRENGERAGWSNEVEVEVFVA